MKIVKEVFLISVGSFEESSDWSIIRAEIREAISLIVHPPGTASFTINPTKHGNGVKPIKEACFHQTNLNRNYFKYKSENPVSITKLTGLSELLL